MAVTTPVLSPSQAAGMTAQLNAAQAMLTAKTGSTPTSVPTKAPSAPVATPPVTPTTPVKTTPSAALTAANSPVKTAPTVYTGNSAASHVTNTLIPAMNDGNAAIQTQNDQRLQEQQQADAHKKLVDMSIANSPKPTTTPDIAENGQQFTYDSTGAKSGQIPIGQAPPTGYTTTPPANPVQRGHTVVGTPVQASNGGSYQQYSDGTYGQLDATGNYVGAVDKGTFTTAQSNDPAVIAGQIRDSLLNLNKGAIPLTPAQQAQINSVNTNLQQLITDQTTANNNFTGGTTVAMNLYGMGNSLAGLGQIKGAVDSVIAAISKLQNDAAGAIAKMTTAFQGENYKEMFDQYQALQSSNNGIQVHIDNLRTHAETLAKNVQDHKDALDAQINSISAEAAKNGKLLPAQQAALQTALTNHDVQGAINAVGGNLQSATGQLGDYLQYKRDAESKGLVPTDYGAWKDANDAKAAKRDINLAYSKAYASASATNSANSQFSSSDKNQQKLEQQYRGVLTKELSNRSGALGTENAKVNQGNHLNALITQYYDPKTGNYNIPTSQYAELAIGLANMISPSGQSSDGDRAQIKAFTAKSDFAGALQYVTGIPQTGNSQEMIKNLVDSVDRQAETAVRNREAALQNMRDMAPTDLDQSRLDALNHSTDMTHYEGQDRIDKSSVESFVTSPAAKQFLDPTILQKISTMSGAQGIHTGGELAIFLGGLPGATPQGVNNTLIQLGLQK